MQYVWKPTVTSSDVLTLQSLKEAIENLKSIPMQHYEPTPCLISIYSVCAYCGKEVFPNSDISKSYLDDFTPASPWHVICRSHLNKAKD